MAAFLVSAGNGSYFGFSNMQDPRDELGLGGWAAVSWDYFPQYDSIVTGQPLGPGEPSADGMSFWRPFERGSVSVDCEAGTYKLDLDGGGSGGISDDETGAGQDDDTDAGQDDAAQDGGARTSQVLPIFAVFMTASALVHASTRRG